MFNNGVLRINNQAGNPEYSLTSQGPSTATTWKQRVYTVADFPAPAFNTSTTETDLYSTTVAADRIGANYRKLVFDASGDFTDATATPRIRVYFAGTLIFDSGALTLSGTGSWNVSVLLMRTGGDVATARAIFTCGVTAITAPVQLTDLTGLDYTTTNIMKITGTATGAGGGSNDIKANFGTITLVPEQ